MGFDRHSAYLLVVSLAGRGLHDDLGRSEIKLSCGAHDVALMRREVLRAVCFSPDGQTVVVAESHTLTMLVR